MSIQSIVPNLILLCMYKIHLLDKLEISEK